MILNYKLLNSPNLSTMLAIFPILVHSWAGKLMARSSMGGRSSSPNSPFTFGASGLLFLTSNSSLKSYKLQGMFLYCCKNNNKELCFDYFE